MNRILYGASRLSEAQREECRRKAVNLCIDRNLTYTEMSKCIICQGFRELWVIVPSEWPHRLI